MAPRQPSGCARPAATFQQPNDGIGYYPGQAGGGVEMMATATPVAPGTAYATAMPVATAVPVNATAAI